MSDQPRAVQPPPTAALSEWSRAGWSLKSSPCQDPHGLPILSLSFSRPAVYNALDTSAMEALSELVTERLCFEDYGALVLSGEGGRFIAGGDLKALEQLTTHEDALELSRLMQEALLSLAHAPIPVICAVEGFAIGGGAEVALACDLCVMAEDAYIRFAQRSLGLSTAWGGASYLREAVGPRRALALLARDDQISAQEAYSLGLAHRLSPSGEALSVALTWAQELASTPQATRALKRLSRDAEGAQRDQLQREREGFAPLWTSAQHWERVEAHWQRRAARRQASVAVALTEPLKEELAEELTEEPHPSSQEEAALKPGLFVVFEGIDGSGTTTQVEQLTERLKAEGVSAHMTNEPSEGVIGRLTRQALRGEAIGREGRQLPAEAIALLFAADRADHWHNEIEPRLKRGEHVICDRYLYSSVAYQSLENPEAWVRSLNSRYPRPDLLIYLKIDPELAAQRRAQRGLEADRYEVDELQREISKRYDRVCQEAEALVLDASQGIESLAELSAEALERLIDERS